MRSILQQGDPGYERNEGNDERKRLVKPMQEIGFYPLVEDKREKKADNGKYESPHDPTSR